MSENWIDSLKEEGGVRPRKTLAEEAADNLREFILLGKLVPGTAIPERDLAEALGVSRTPLREALHEMLQNRMVVKSMFYMLLDLVWEEIFPEMKDILTCGEALDINFEEED